jgi:hypothetical protein
VTTTRQLSRLAGVIYLATAGCGAPALDCAQQPWFVHVGTFTDVKCYMYAGAPEAAGLVAEAEPGDKTVRELSAALRDRGWSLASGSVLNPGVKSSDDHWGHLQRPDGQMVSRWATEWEDKGKNLVMYAVDYIGPSSGIRHVSSGTLMVKYVTCASVGDMLRSTGGPARACPNAAAK